MGCVEHPYTQPDGPHSPADGGARHGACAAAPAWGAPPGNTAPQKYTADELRASKLVPGSVDSLYVSFAGTLFAAVAEELVDRKQLAQCPEDEAKELAQYHVGSMLFSVSDKGRRRAEFVLRSPHCQLEIARGPRVPLAYVQIASAFLSGVGVDVALDQVRRVVNALGAVAGDETVSRLDLCVDFVPSLPLRHWSDERWVTRAARIDSHSVRGRFTGWSFGAGAVLSARLYDKRYEVENISHKLHVSGRWEEAGIDWKEPVWRLEFQLCRPALKEFGIQCWADARARLGDLWAYCMNWLSLREPDGDGNRSRWPVAPLWNDLAGASWSGVVGPLKRCRTAGDLGIRKMTQILIGLIASSMAARGSVDFSEGLGELLHVADTLCMNDGQTLALCVERKARVKAAKLCTVNNRAMRGVDAARTEAAASAYRQRRSDPGYASGTSGVLSGGSR